MTSQKKLHRAKVKKCWGKILLAMIFSSSLFFYSSRNGRTVIGRDFKFFDKTCIKVSKLTAMLLNKKPWRFRQGFHFYAAFDSLSSFILLIRISFALRSNHFTSTTLFLMYFNTSTTLPSILLRTRSPFLNNLFI